MNKKHQELRKKFDEQYRAYLEKFGQDSLDRVSLWDPLGYSDEWTEVLPEATEDLRRAIETGIPIEPDPEDAIY